MLQDRKIIHYFLEGELKYDFRDSWRKYAPDYEIMEWNSSNLPIPEELEVHVRDKRWALISDFVRRWAVLEHGGLYLDFDIELIKSPDEVLEYESFVCIEAYPVFANAAVTGGYKGNRHHNQMMDDYMKVIRGEKKFPVPLEPAAGPWVVTDYVKGFKRSEMEERDVHEIMSYDGFVTLPKEYFFPYNWNEPIGGITEKTIGIHHWKKGW